MPQAKVDNGVPAPLIINGRWQYAGSCVPLRVQGGGVVVPVSWRYVLGNVRGKRAHCLGVPTTGATFERQAASENNASNLGRTMIKPPPLGQCQSNFKRTDT
ncbi:uncharacterized protein BBA_01204 [Beauveria bassiana ARSEF 2860]|uniref:Uncharacterized protein n=1 Tax=Beauveria bassiana (strain ARSEF 2860) TaxID=655819 RepID=J4WKR9_BEAB2|nr:uncharacterized protein BBA_01204 [Beauveria bassiana ARSEF 2860]EJP70335.1 hypothetical protein BBA_01204 [Beauveria bassiana ARSEF 2860]